MSAAEKVELATIRDPDKADVLARVKAAGFDTGKDCEHCKGSGRVYPGERIIHSRLGGLGADWDEQSVLNAVENAEALAWGDGWGHDLAVKMSDRGWIKFDVPHPDRPEGDQ